MIPILLFMLSAALAVEAPPGKQLKRLEAAPELRSLPLWLPRSVLALAGMISVWLFLGPRVLGWVMAVGVLLGTVAWLLRRARCDRLRARSREDAARSTNTLALLLQAGQIPTRALDDAASDCAALLPVARTGRLGGDIAAAFTELGAQPGAGGYRRVAAAWFVSERTGAPIALVLGRVAENLRQERHLAAVVAAELATARSSGRIMAALPFVAIGLGTVVGADPLAFLFGSWLGQVAFLAGTALVAGGVVWTEHIARSGEHSGARR
ncbi:MAG: type II secretion system F family protein [Arachnia sp.]